MGFIEGGVEKMTDFTEEVLTAIKEVTEGGKKCR
jgi:hypothetical protein